MSKWLDYKPGVAALTPGGRYELVYTSGFTFPLQADPETVRFVVGNRSEGVAVDTVDIDPIDREIHVFVVAGKAGPVDELVPVKMQAVPADEWHTIPSTIANLAGVEGVARLDRLRWLGQASQPFEEVEAREEAANERLGEGDVRDSVASVSRTLKGAGQQVTGLAIGAVVLWGITQVMDLLDEEG